MEDRRSYWQRKGGGFGTPYGARGQMGQDLKHSEARAWRSRTNKAPLTFKGQGLHIDDTFGLGFYFSPTGIKEPDR